MNLKRITKKGAYLILTILSLTPIYLAINSFVMSTSSENLVSQTEKLVEIGQYDDNYGSFLGLDFEEDIMVIASMEGIIILNKSLPDSLSFHREIKGNVKEVKIQNESIFGLNSSMLMSYNISKENETELLDNYLFQGYLGNLQLWKGFAFVVDGGNLSILNISDPKNMQSITNFSIPDNNIADYAVDGERLYILDSAGQMRVVDISNITKPTESEIYQDVESKFYQIRINNNYAYLLDNSNKFVVLNISNISNITQLSESGIEDWVERIFVENNFAYILSDTSLSIINVTDATSLQNITKLSAIELGISYSWFSCLGVAGNYIYLTDINRGVFIIDISTINVPQLVSEFSNGGIARQVCLQEDYLYLADGDAGLEVFDITNRSHPQKISQYQSPNIRYCNSIIVEDGYGYILDYYGHVEILSITDGDEITSIGNYHQPFVEYYDFTLYSQYLIIAAESTGIVILDISSKTNPREVETIFDGNCYYSLAIDGKNLYTISAGGIPKMKVYDFSNPANPQLITEYLLPNNTYWRYITVNEDRACITSSYDNILLFLDISSPNNPQYIGEYRDETLVSINTVQFVGGYLCTGGSTGINIFDIKDITAPQKITHYYDGGVTFGMELKDNYFYIADGYDNLEILETSIKFYFQFNWNAIIILLSILGTIGISTAVYIIIRKRR